jgi:hypothetical protein
MNLQKIKVLVIGEKELRLNFINHYNDNKEQYNGKMQLGYTYTVPKYHRNQVIYYSVGEINIKDIDGVISMFNTHNDHQNNTKWLSNSEIPAHIPIVYVCCHCHVTGYGCFCHVNGYSTTTSQLFRESNIHTYKIINGFTELNFDDNHNHTIAIPHYKDIGNMNIPLYMISYRVNTQRENVFI